MRLWCSGEELSGDIPEAMGAGMVNSGETIRKEFLGTMVLKGTCGWFRKAVF